MIKARLAGLAIAAALTGAAQAQQLGVGIGTMEQGTSGYSMGAATACVLSENGSAALVPPNAGTSSYLPLFDMGELDLEIANAIEVVDATTGSGDFDGRALERIAPAARLFPLRFDIFARGGSGIETVADLAGEPVT